jgi:hypothetical protein
MSEYNDYVKRYQGLHEGTDAFMDAKGELRKSKGLFDGKNFEEKLWKHLKPMIAGRDSFRFLDYGCGKAKHVFASYIEGKTLLEQFAGKCQCLYLYDPGFKKYAKHPGYGIAFDFVSCSDVMEHVPEAVVGDVLADIATLTHGIGTCLFSIAGAPAYKSFADGENLHCTVKPLLWWIEQLERAGINRYILVYTDKFGEKTATKGVPDAAV